MSNDSSNVTVEILSDRKVAHVEYNANHWDFAQWFADTTREARVSIQDLSSRVGMLAWKLRQIARGLKKDENFNPLETYLESRGQDPAFTELYLNEAEALYLCAKLRTEKAKKITWEMIHVYMLARRGLCPQPDGNASVFQTLANTLTELQKQQGQLIHALTGLQEQQGQTVAAILKITERLTTLEERIASDTGSVGEDWAEKHIRERLRYIANLHVGILCRNKLSNFAKGKHRSLTNNLEKQFGFGRRGCSWDQFPKGPMVTMLVSQLNVLEEEAIKVFRKTPDPRQKSFSFDRNNIH